MADLALLLLLVAFALFHHRWFHPPRFIPSWRTRVIRVDRLNDFRLEIRIARRPVSTCWTANGLVGFEWRWFIATRLPGELWQVASVDRGAGSGESWWGGA